MNRQPHGRWLHPRQPACRARGRVVHLARGAAQEDRRLGEAARGRDRPVVGGDRPVGRQARAADVPAGACPLRGRRDGRDRRRPARSLRPLGGRCPELDPAPERGRRAARLGRGQLRRLDADGPLRDRDPDPDRRARAGADQGELGDRGQRGGRARRPHLGAAADRLPARREGSPAPRRAGRLARSPRLFRRRALGASWAELARFLEEQEVYPPTGNPHWSKTGVAELLKNPVYLGQARSGKVRQRGRARAARDPGRVRRRPGDDEVAASSRATARSPRKAMLGGLAPLRRLRAHAQDHRQHRARRPASAIPSTTASAATRTGLCPARATIRASLRRRLRRGAGASGAASRGRSARPGGRGLGGDRGRQRAPCPRPSTSSTCSSNNPKLLSLLGEQKFLEGVEVRQRALDEARAALAEARSQSALAERAGRRRPARAWPRLAIQERRRLLHGLLDRVVVTRADRRGRHARPIGERTQIVLRGNVSLLEPAAPPTRLELNRRARSISSIRYESGSCTKQMREPPSRTAIWLALWLDPLFLQAASSVASRSSTPIAIWP